GSIALPIYVTISATGSVIVIIFASFLQIYLLYYQLALFKPGICPSCATSRRQSLHNLNLRYTECGLPQRSHLVYSWVEYLAGLLFFSINAFLAILYHFLLEKSIFGMAFLVLQVVLLLLHLCLML